jgi:hypothetical protein
VDIFSLLKGKKIWELHLKANAVPFAWTKLAPGRRAVCDLYPMSPIARCSFNRRKTMGVKRKMQEAGNKINETATQVGHRVSEGAEKAADWVKEKAHEARDRASETAQKIKNRVGESADTVSHANIREHMDVVGSCGNKLGVVDHVEGDSIKLTKSDSPDGQHHLIPLNWVEKVDTYVHLNKKCGEAQKQWK